MAPAVEAGSLAPGALRGIIDSLYTPFNGSGRDEIEHVSLRSLALSVILLGMIRSVRYPLQEHHNWQHRRARFIKRRMDHG